MLCYIIFMNMLCRWVICSTYFVTIFLKRNVIIMIITALLFGFVFNWNPFLIRWTRRNPLWSVKDSGSSYFFTSALFFLSLSLGRITDDCSRAMRLNTAKSQHTDQPFPLPPTLVIPELNRWCCFSVIGLLHKLPTTKLLAGPFIPGRCSGKKGQGMFVFLVRTFQSPHILLPLYSAMVCLHQE